MHGRGSDSKRLDEKAKSTGSVVVGADEEDQGDLQERRDSCDSCGDVPLVPRLEPNLPHDDILARRSKRTVPLHVLPDPLLHQDAEKCGSEAEDEAEEPQNVDPPGSTVCHEIKRRKGRLGRTVGETGGQREALELDRDTLEKPHGFFVGVHLELLV